LNPPKKGRDPQMGEPLGGTPICPSPKILKKRKKNAKGEPLNCERECVPKGDPPKTLKDVHKKGGAKIRQRPPPKERVKEICPYPLKKRPLQKESTLFKGHCKKLAK